MQLNQIPTAPNAAALVNHIINKLSPATLAVEKVSPDINRSPAQINRTYEMSKDPPVTVMKYTNSVTHEVELQIPSEASLQIYKDVQRFIKQQQEQSAIVNIQV
jgi:hypothetical protein